MAAVTFLGTGPGDVLAGRFQSSILLESPGGTILLDAGEPCTAQLLNLGFALPDLDAVWITHAHSDHVGGLPLFLQASWLHGRKAGLPLGLPAHLVEPLKGWLQAVFLGALPFDLAAFSWQAGHPVSLGGLTVTPHRTSHLERLRIAAADAKLESFLFEITDGPLRILYSGDLGAAADLAPVLAKPADVLICELAHVSVEELLQTLAEARVGVLCLTHVAGSFDDDQREEIRMRIERELSGVDEVYLPDDGERIEF